MDFNAVNSLVRLRVAAGTLFSLAALTASAQARYHIDDLGGAPMFGPRMALNAAGVGVGSSGTTTIYDHGTVTNLRLAGGSPGNEGDGINDAGVIVGTSWDYGYNGTVWVYKDGRYTRVDTKDSFPGAHAMAGGINNLGQVAGSLQYPGNVGHPFLLRNGNLEDLGLPEGSTGAWAYGINDHHVVVGTASMPGFWGRAFAWSGGKMHVLPLPGNAQQGSAGAQGVNNAGVIVGSWFPDWNMPTHLVRWQDGVGTDLGALPGSSGVSLAYGINDAGTIVGSASMQFPDATSLAMVYDDANGMRDLNTLVDESGFGWQLSVAYAINASGQILGVGRYNDDSHAFLATPLP
jgi:uncharacterized membrane protein